MQINKKRKYRSRQKELLAKSREAVLTAIKVFNDPLICFKSETYIVLMIIAWTYMLHAYYRSKNIEYRYYRQRGKRKLFDRTKHGEYKYWELENCLNDEHSPIKKDVKNNLLFLIGLRNEIEHQMTASLDSYLSGRYQATALNYNYYIKELFGVQYGLDEYITYSIQLLEITEEQLTKSNDKLKLTKSIREYIAGFDDNLTDDEYNSPQYSYRLIFTRKVANRKGQADRIVEFIDPNSELAKTIDKEYWVIKDKEKPKYRPKDVVAEVNKAGFTKYRIQPEHLQMWKEEDAKNHSKGFGVDIQGTWYWYENWIKHCIELCDKAGTRYR